MNQDTLQNHPQVPASELIPLARRRAAPTPELSQSEAAEPLEFCPGSRRPTPSCRHGTCMSPSNAHAASGNDRTIPDGARMSSPNVHPASDNARTASDNVRTVLPDARASTACNLASIGVVSAARPAPDCATQPTADHAAQPTADHAAQPAGISVAQSASDNAAQPTAAALAVVDGIYQAHGREFELFESDAAGFLIPIPASSIIPNRFQPRKRFDALTLERLAASIRHYGILQPITVRKLPGTQPPKYEIVCGERRYRAGIMAGIDVFRCHLLQESDLRVAELSVIENLLRDDLNIFEQAEAFHLLITTFGLTQQQVAERIGLSQSAVANKLRLLRLSAVERQGILENDLTERHARCLLRLDEPQIRLKFIELIAKDRLNVSSTEQLIEKYIKYTASMHDSAQSAPPPERHHRTTVGVLHDVRLFSNSIEKAADILRNCGIAVETQCREEPGAFLYTIRVAKQSSEA